MITKKADDCVLINAYSQGNEKAFGFLLMRHKDVVYRTILSKVHDSELAEDIFQETFMKIIEKLKKGDYTDEGKFRQWALRIANNLIIDHFRRVQRRKTVLESSSKFPDFTIFDILKDQNENVEQLITRTELETEVLGFVDFLPFKQRNILKMRIFQDLSYNEISEIENISVNTALGRMRYALINLRKILEKNDVVLEY